MSTSHTTLRPTQTQTSLGISLRERGLLALGGPWQEDFPQASLSLKSSSTSKAREEGEREREGGKKGVWGGGVVRKGRGRGGTEGREKEKREGEERKERKKGIWVLGTGRETGGGERGSGGDRERGRGKKREKFSGRTVLGKQLVNQRDSSLAPEGPTLLPTHRKRNKNKN